MADGVPLELYGGPLFPVAVVLDYEDQVVAPFWANISGNWPIKLKQAASYTHIRQCLLNYQPLCKDMMRTEFKKLLGELFPYVFAPSISYHLAYEVREERWTVEPLDAYKDSSLVLVRRSLLIQCLYWCHTMLSLSPERRPMMLEVCPNACNRPGVCRGTGDLPGTCRMTGEGFFAHQFRCDCRFGYEWDARIQSCAVDNPCTREHNPACNRVGTLYCSHDAELQEVSCLCKPEYMGESCSVPANACEDYIQNPLLPNGGLLAVGNRACNVNNDGNQCLPSLDPQLGPIYTCACTAGRWIGDIALRYDNCLKKITKCDQIICINGECVDSRDGKEAVCVCKEGYEGSPMCAHWTGVWTSWSPWGRCTPSCGLQRWSVRTRRCLHSTSGTDEIHRECVGSGLEFSACEAHDCAHEEEQVLERYFVVREQAVQATLALGAIGAAALALLWKFTLFASLALAVRRIFLRPRNQL